MHYRGKLLCFGANHVSANWGHGDEWLFWRGGCLRQVSLCISECVLTAFNGIIRGLNRVNKEAINVNMILLYMEVTDSSSCSAKQRLTGPRKV